MMITLLTAIAGYAQPVYTARNMALGGGGTAYLTGFEANFINPANAMIRTRSTSVMIGLGQAGYVYDPFLPVSGFSDHLKGIRNIFRPYEPNGEALSTSQVTDVLLRNFRNERLRSEHQQRYDIILGGIALQSGNQTFTFAARNRVATRVELGRGWYDPEFIQTNTSSVRDFSLIQQTQYMYEFSIGYSQQLDFIDGLIPRLGELYIGIAPKFIVGGEYLNLNYNAHYELLEQGSTPRLIQSLTLNSAGGNTDAVESYRLNEDPGTAIGRLPDASLLFKPVGYGAGLDFGLTYVLALGDDLSLADPKDREPLSKSLRVGFSITDIGFVSYTESPLSIRNTVDTTQATPAAVTDNSFEGRTGQYISFFDDAEAPHNALRNSTVSDREPFRTILPTSVNAGVLLQLNRVKLASDLTLGLNDTAYGNTKLVGHIGIEFHPLKPVPVRLGSRFAAGDPAYWSLGTGIEAEHWELSVASRFSARSITGTADFSGAVFGGLSFHF